MYRILLSFLVFLSVCSKIQAQYDGFGADEISRFRPGSMWFFTGFRPAKPEKVRKYDRLIIDLTYNDWMGDIDPFKGQWNSIGFNSSLMFDIPISVGNTVSFGTGISYSLFRINTGDHHFQADSTGNYTVDLYGTVAGPTASDRHLCGHSFSVPLEFRFRSKGWKHFKFHIGGKIGYQFDMYDRTVSEGEYGKTIIKDHGLPDVNRLIYSAHVRIGLRNWALFGSYNLNKLFKDERSSQLNLLQMGLSLSLF